MRNVPASRSSIAPKTLGPSKRGRHIHSTAPLGAISAHVSQSERNAYSAIGGTGETSDVSLKRDWPVIALAKHLGRRVQRGPVGRVAQQRLADALAEDARFAAGGSHHGPLRLLALARLAPRAQPPGAPVELDRRAARGLQGDSGPPGATLLLLGLELEVVLALARGRPARQAAVAPAGGQRAGLPAQPRRQPAEEQHAGGR